MYFQSRSSCKTTRNCFLETDPDSGHKWLRCGAWLYGLHRTCAETAGVSRGTSHVAPKQRCEYITSADIQKRAILYIKKATITHFESDATRPRRVCSRAENSPIYKSNQTIKQYIRGHEAPHHPHQSVSQRCRAPYMLHLEHTMTIFSVAPYSSFPLPRPHQYPPFSVILKLCHFLWCC